MDDRRRVADALRPLPHRCADQSFRRERCHLRVVGGPSLADIRSDTGVTELRRNPRWQSVFFTLKDPSDGACLGVTIARSRFDALRLDLRDGERVHVYGRPELFEAKDCATVDAFDGSSYVSPWTSLMWTCFLFLFHWVT